MHVQSIFNIIMSCNGPEESYVYMASSNDLDFNICENDAPVTIIVSMHTHTHAHTHTHTHTHTKLKEPLLLQPLQETTYGYLLQYVGNMRNAEVRDFLLFVTGSSALVIDEIKVLSMV